MWYCEIEFISKSKKTIVFRNEKEAEKFVKIIVNKNFSLNSLLYIYNNGIPILINVNNVEVISTPKQYKNEK